MPAAGRSHPLVHRRDLQKPSPWAIRMARQRITATELARTLNATTQPIYVLDDESVVVFFNRACQKWLGAAAQGLIGRRCTYHSSPAMTGPDAVAAGLCPPPAALDGLPLVATVARNGKDGLAAFRRARFLPLGTGPEDLVGLIALVDAEDLDLAEVPTGESSPESLVEDGPTELHKQIQRFRREAAARFQADRLIGNSPAIRRARRQIELAAGSRASVLVLGPVGSGRQHVATAIHYGGTLRAPGSRPAGSLIPLACSVLGAELIHSTIAALATGSPLGDEAEYSTLLLGDVDQLPVAVQGELAAAISERNFPLRVIATAERPLLELAGRGAYNEGLAGLLGTITIELPPLIQRREDLPLLAQLFLEEANACGTRQLAGFSLKALDRLDAYGWPGNVDELAQVVALAHRSAAGPEIGVDDLPEQIRLAAAAAAYPHAAEESIVLDEFLGQVERELIRRALAQGKGNKAKAARLLGMTRPRLYRRLVQLGLQQER